MGQEKTSFKFDFGNEKTKPGWIQISPTNVYSDAAGYGFEPGAALTAAAGCVTSTNPFYFSVRLPEGNYRVSVTLGGPAGESTTTGESFTTGESSSSESGESSTGASAVTTSQS